MYVYGVLLEIFLLQNVHVYILRQKFGMMKRIIGGKNKK